MKNLFFLTILLILILFLSCISFQPALKDLKEQNDSFREIDRNIVFTLLFACKQTYNSFADIPLIPIPGYKEPKIFHGTILQNHEKIGLVYQSDDNSKVIIAYRGSKTLQDWINDFRFNLVENYESDYVQEPGIKVAHGFFEAHRSTRTEILDILDNFGVNNSTTVYVTGHSLGGSIGILFVLDYIYNYHSNNSNVYLYTYASPRVGNKQFTDVYSNYVKNSIRIVNQADTIPEVPLKKFGQYNYKHIKQQYTLFFYPKKYGMEVGVPKNEENYLFYVYNTFEFGECRKACHALNNYFYALEKVLYYNSDYPVEPENEMILLNPILKYLLD